MSVHVKICGITSVADATLAVQSGADLVGLNFYPPSPRYISLDTARGIRAALPAGVWCVGVFVDAERAYIASLVEQLGLHAVQFSGDEATADLQGWSCPTIKTVRIAADGLLPEWDTIAADYLLLDTYRAGRYGGTGATFAWERARALPPQHISRLFLAGGLTPDNVAAAVRLVRPWAVDVASGVESAPGHKDPDKVRAFLTNAKTA